MAWKPEVKVDGTWHRNGLVFATETEAHDNAADLYGRWVLTTGFRAVEVDEPVNYRFVAGKLEAVA